ncbi:hypothetical protein [Plantibacter sp. CFBP 13570]|uniref:hypothetical protein n=1 Tax=Plantibacter sp. CFBP 13570 TaxID=2775272 RepID=UPI0019308EFD|nr:hypothetical protein [Plantibacter sp. CFBP 13570]MBD8535935.1 hypothetical protein [Plantibacter sp. CFBP 13570]
MDSVVLATAAFLGICFVLAAISIFRHRSQAALTFWLAVACFVPYWLSAPTTPFVPLLVIVTGVVALSTLRRRHVRFRPSDWCLIGLGVVAGVAAATGAADLNDALVLLGQWVVPYFVGRALFLDLGMAQIARMVAIAVGLVAACAVVELALDWHPFTALTFADSFTFRTWAWIQYRGGTPRSEWVFGHSIALGNILAMGIPFAIFAGFRTPATAALVGLMLIGTGATLSRNALLAAVLSLGLSILILRAHTIRTGLRILVVSVMVLASILVLPMIAESFSAAGDEVSDSSNYRLLMLSLLPTIRIFGSSGTYVQLYDGQMGYLSSAYAGGAARSVDNSFVLLGLNMGWLAVGLAVMAILFIAIGVFRGSRNPALIALVGQVPTIMTVAMITQYSSFFWLVVGIASAAQGVFSTQALALRRSSSARAQIMMPVNP